MNKGIRNIIESLIGELMDMQVFWSYKKPDLYDLSDEMLIEKVLLHSDLDSIYRLFDIFPESQIRKIWEQRLLPDESMHSTNLLFAFLLFRIKDSGGFSKSKISTYWRTIC